MRKAVLNYLLALCVSCLFFRAFRRNENIITKVMMMMSRTPSPATKPANCDEDTTLPLSEAGDFSKFVGLDEAMLIVLFLSETANQVEVIIIKVLSQKKSTATIKSLITISNIN